MNQKDNTQEDKTERGFQCPISRFLKECKGDTTVPLAALKEKIKKTVRRRRK